MRTRTKQPAMGSNNVVIINTAYNTVVTSITSGFYTPIAVAVSPSGSYAHVPVMVIDWPLSIIGVMGVIEEIDRGDGGKPHNNKQLLPGYN